MAKQTWININNVWRKVKSVWVNVNGVWKKDVMPKGVVNGGYKEFMQYYMPFIFVGGEDENGTLQKIDYNGNVVKEVSVFSPIRKIKNDYNGNVIVATDNEVFLYDVNLNKISSIQFSNTRQIGINANGTIALCNYRDDSYYRRVELYNADLSERKGQLRTYLLHNGIDADEKGDFYISGGGSSNAGRKRIIKLDENGNLIWETQKETEVYIGYYGMVYYNNEIFFNVVSMGTSYLRKLNSTTGKFILTVKGERPVAIDRNSYLIGINNGYEYMRRYNRDNLQGEPLAMPYYPKDVSASPFSDHLFIAGGHSNSIGFKLTMTEEKMLGKNIWERKYPYEINMSSMPGSRGTFPSEWDNLINN